ncbi:MAG: hypothetical protein ACMXYF_00440 [Candidatus Woesearchaeota archaeon]
MFSRGQVAVFVIVGVVVLLLASVYFMYQSALDVGDSEVSRTVSEVVPDEFIRVREFVQQCLNDIGLRGLEKAASQGGYIYPERFGIQAQHFAPTTSNAFTLAQGSNPVPYWYYLATPNDCSGNCIFLSEQPYLRGPEPDSIQSQLNSYVREELPFCIRGFTALGDEGFTVEVLGDFEVFTYFHDQNVQFFLEYPLEVTFQESTSRVSEYQVYVDVPFMRLYELAAMLTGLQSEFRYLEHTTMELISLYSGLDRNKLPPTSGSTYEYVAALFWPVTQVEFMLRDILQTYVSAVQVQGVSNYMDRTEQFMHLDGPQSRVLAIQRLYEKFDLPLGVIPYDGPVTVPQNLIERYGEELAETIVRSTQRAEPNPDFVQRFGRFEVYHSYSGQQMYFNVNDDGGLIKPNSLSVDFFGLLPFGFQQYDVLYDVAYPVLVEVYDPDALGGQGFTFAFGLETNVENNEPLVETFTRLERANFDRNLEMVGIRTSDLGDFPVEFINLQNSQRLRDVQTLEPSVYFDCSEVGCTVRYGSQEQQFLFESGALSSDQIFVTLSQIAGVENLVSLTVSRPRPQQHALPASDETIVDILYQCENADCALQFRSPNETIRYKPSFAPPQQTFFCHPQQRTSGNISLSVTDKITGEPLEGIGVTYYCGDEACPILVTNSDGSGKAQFPICGGGTLEFFGGDYRKKYVDISTTRGEEMHLDVELIRPEQREATVQRYLYEKVPVQVGPIHNPRIEWVWGNLSQEPRDLRMTLDGGHEVAYVTFEKVDLDPREDPFTFGFEYDVSKAQGVVVDGQNTGESVFVDILPGEYKVTVLTVLYEDIVIPECSYREGSRPFRITVVEPEVDFRGQFPSGGVTLDQTTSFWEFTKDDFQESDLIIFSAITVEIPELLDQYRLSDGTVPSCRVRAKDMEAIEHIPELTIDNIDKVLPRAIRRNDE